MTTKRHAPGLYTIGDLAISRECDCSGYCDARWVARKVELWVNGYPSELGYWGEARSTKKELLAYIRDQH
jgi:hypothetical protein